jgi:predicted transporter
VAFALVRIAGILLVSHGCDRTGTMWLGQSPATLAIAGITLLGALATIGAGLLAWRIWRRTSMPQDEVSDEGIPRVPFWALGGMLLSAFFLFGILITGGIGVTLSTACP